MDCISIATLVVAIISVCVAIIGVCVAIKNICVASMIFKRATTLQAEMFIFGTHKDYMICREVDEKHNAKIRFLAAIDLYCKYVMKGCLDEQLSEENTHFLSKCIKECKDIIRENEKICNNIIDYAKKYNISLD